MKKDERKRGLFGRKKSQYESKKYIHLNEFLHTFMINLEELAKTQELIDEMTRQGKLHGESLTMAREQLDYMHNLLKRSIRKYIGVEERDVSQANNTYIKNMHGDICINQNEDISVTRIHEINYKNINYTDSRYARLVELVYGAIDTWAFENQFQHMSKNLIFEQAIEVMASMISFVNNDETL